MSEFFQGAALPSNRLLAALPAADFAALRRWLEPVERPLQDVLIEPDAPITDVHFPESGWVSMVAMLADGDSAEVGMVGVEGMVGLPLLLGVASGFVEGIVQGPGTMLRMSAANFRRALDGSAALTGLLLRYALAFQEQLSQTAACNGHHALQQRLARWLMMAHDRAGTDEFAMTHEFLAQMLCVHRPGVTVAARQLQRAGLIRYGQGRMAIADRAGLEATACECYGVVQRRFAAVLGFKAP